MLLSSQHSVANHLLAVFRHPIEFDAKLRDKLLALAANTGNSHRGAKLFFEARVGCAICHKVGRNGGTIGPDLSAVGSGVPPERIVTEVMWPAHQVKDGYSLARVTTKDGRVLLGYPQEDRDEKVLRLQDFSTSGVEELAVDQIAKRETVGSLMPATAQTLERSELADLLAYLFQLGS